MIKKLFLTIVISLTLGSISTLHAATGVVFVHGKGSADLASPSTAFNYWGSDMIRASTANYKVPYYIAHYDGTRDMEVSGNTVADQIADFINNENITDLIINTHSFGGVVTRWIFSNPTHGANYQTVINATRWINAIAAPQKGSEAADMAGMFSGTWLTGWIVDLVGQKNDSTTNCETDSMAYYNKYWLNGTSGRPALPKTFYWISGWGLWNDYFGAWHSEDIGLATLSGVAMMPGEDDGMVSEYSAEAVGTQWFRTKANHHHNRRNDYKNIGDMLGSDLENTQ
ncbi:MAG: hypothetical protein GY710_13960 [Desulfobacteraceae bacterium]|nr:hypothetical protein [Desulfobacteraceae bacterium]